MKMVMSQYDKRKGDTVRFIDYFFMCGLCESSSAKVYKIHDEDVAAESKEKKLVSSVLCHFPTNIPDNPWNSAELWKLCTPHGLAIGVGETLSLRKPHFHSFLITREDGSKTYGHVLTFFELCVDSKQRSEILVLLTIADILQVENVDDKTKVYVEKCMGFITQVAFLRICEKILRKLFKLFMFNSPSPSNNNNLPLESYIYNLLYEIPLLLPGSSLKVACMGHDDPVILHLPSSSELPLLDVNLSEVFRLLGGAKNLLNLLTSLLFEHQILLVSEDRHKLAVLAEGVTALLFPFQWQHTHVSVLPYELASHFFDAPVPYLIGVVVLPGQKELIRQVLEVNQCYVDLDQAIVESPEDQPCFPNQEYIVNQLERFMGHYDNERKLLSVRKKENSANKSEGELAGSVPPRENNSLAVQSSEEAQPLHANATVSKVASIAKKAGVISSLDDVGTLHADTSVKIGSKLQVSKKALCEQKFNVKVRETLASAFLAIFSQYDKFVILPSLDETGLWTFSTETQDNFDKASFLSDQPEARLPFLLSFLDTQMFASFIDNSIISHQPQTNTDEAKDPYLRLFDERIEQSRIPLDPRSPTSITPHTVISVFRSVSITSNIASTSHTDTWIIESENLVEKRLSQIDTVSCPLHAVHMSLDKDTSGITIMNVPGTFPVIRSQLLESEGIGFDSKKRHLRRNNESRRTIKKQVSVRGSKWRKIQEARSKLLRQPSMSEYSPEIIAQTNWMFVEKLLKDVKHKTKKILVGKMGKEAIELGHGELSDSVSNLEESTWIASLCDLLERVWNHGLLSNYKKGRSALWSHLLQYQAAEEEKRRKKIYQYHGGSTPSLVTEPGHTPTVTQHQSFDSATSYYSLPRSFPRKQQSMDVLQKNESPKHVPQSYPYEEYSISSNPGNIPKLSYSILSSMRRIQSMKEVQTEVGRSRAWIRLALEQKQLHSYLRELLRDHRLLDRMYKIYSLLQCDDQREQFLYHLLSLEASDFTCFTNSFPRASIEYKVWIVPGKSSFAGSSQTSANVYISLCGELCRTERISVPKGCLEFSFKHQNLGALVTSLIGHDNAGMLPKWLLDDVIVQNQITGETTCFSCRRWLGKGVDDGSLERLLVAEVVPRNEEVLKFAARLSRQNQKNVTSTTIPDLQEKVGQAVNDIVKYSLKPCREHKLDLSRSTASFTKLLFNLVVALERVFTHGLKTGGFFKRRLFAVDVIATSIDYFKDNISLPLHSNRGGGLPHQSFSNNVADGGDWFLGSRRTSAIGTGLVRRSKDPVDSRRDVNDVLKSDACLAKERVSFARLCQLYQQITMSSGTSQRLGKDDVFYLLACIGLREHSIPLWLPRISDVAMDALNTYDDSAFLCDQSAVTFLGQVLSILSEYEIPLDPSLLRGYDYLVDA